MGQDRTRTAEAVLFKLRKVAVLVLQRQAVAEAMKAASCPGAAVIEVAPHCWRREMRD